MSPSIEEHKASTALVVITDGRGEYLEQTIAAAQEHLKVKDDGWAFGLMVDDSGDPEYAKWLEGAFGDSFWYFHHETRQGLGATVRDAWSKVLEWPNVECVFHLEDDMVLTSPIDIEAMAETLAAEPRLAQLVLKREPWSVEEYAAGGQMELMLAQGDELIDREIFARDGSVHFTEHRRLFSFNPSLIRREALEVGVGGLERDVTDRLLAAGYSFAYWGHREDPPLVRHIGHDRAPGYRL